MTTSRDSHAANTAPPRCGVCLHFQPHSPEDVFGYGECTALREYPMWLIDYVSEHYNDVHPYLDASICKCFIEVKYK